MGFYDDDRNIIINVGLEGAEGENIKDETCCFHCLSASVSVLGREQWKLQELQGSALLSLEQRRLCKLLQIAVFLA